MVACLCGVVFVSAGSGKATIAVRPLFIFFFFLDKAALVVTTVAVMKLC